MSADPAHLAKLQALRDAPVSAGSSPVGMVGKPGVSRGYAAPPGTGPAGETCQSCKHYVVSPTSYRFRKCFLSHELWTGGRGTDIKARAPACSKWTPAS